MAHPIKREKQFEIFPNPAFDYIEIISDYQDLSNPEIFIYSSYGKLFKKVVQNGKVDISDLASGLYFVGINGDAFHEFKALIIFR